MDAPRIWKYSGRSGARERGSAKVYVQPSNSLTVACSEERKRVKEDGKEENERRSRSEKSRRKDWTALGEELVQYTYARARDVSRSSSPGRVN